MKVQANDLVEVLHLDEESKAVLIAGQLAGLCANLDDKALEKFLDHAPDDFRYEKACRAAIKFRRAIFRSSAACSCKTE
jgi:hypothetical protein